MMEGGLKDVHPSRRIDNGGIEFFRQLTAREKTEAEHHAAVILELTRIDGSSSVASRGDYGRPISPPMPEHIEVPDSASVAALGRLIQDCDTLSDTAMSGLPLAIAELVSVCQERNNRLQEAEVVMQRLEELAASLLLMQQQQYVEISATPVNSQITPAQRSDSMLSNSSTMPTVDTTVGSSTLSPVRSSPSPFAALSTRSSTASRSSDPPAGLYSPSPSDENTPNRTTEDPPAMTSPAPQLPNLPETEMGETVTAPNMRYPDPPDAEEPDTPGEPAENEFVTEAPSEPSVSEETFQQDIEPLAPTNPELSSKISSDKNGHSTPAEAVDTAPRLVVDTATGEEEEVGVQECNKEETEEDANKEGEEDAEEKNTLDEAGGSGNSGNMQQPSEPAIPPSESGQSTFDSAMVQAIAEEVFKRMMSQAAGADMSSTASVGQGPSLLKPPPASSLFPQAAPKPVPNPSPTPHKLIPLHLQQVIVRDAAEKLSAKKMLAIDEEEDPKDWTVEHLMPPKMAGQQPPPQAATAQPTQPTATVEPPFDRRTTTASWQDPPAPNGREDIDDSAHKPELNPNKTQELPTRPAAAAMDPPEETDKKMPAVESPPVRSPEGSLIVAETKEAMKSASEGAEGAEAVAHAQAQAASIESAPGAFRIGLARPPPAESRGSSQAAASRPGAVRCEPGSDEEPTPRTKKGLELQEMQSAAVEFGITDPDPIHIPPCVVESRDITTATETDIAVPALTRESTEELPASRRLPAPVIVGANVGLHSGRQNGRRNIFESQRDMSLPARSATPETPSTPPTPPSEPESSAPQDLVEAQVVGDDRDANILQLTQAVVALQQDMMRREEKQVAQKSCCIIL